MRSTQAAILPRGPAGFRDPPVRVSGSPNPWCPWAPRMSDHVCLALNSQLQDHRLDSCCWSPVPGWKFHPSDTQSEPLCSGCWWVSKEKQTGI